MAKDRSLVRASDVGAWSFCHRAWWLANVQGETHRNPGQLETGDRFHLAHGRQLSQATLLQRAARRLILAAALLAVAALLLWLWLG